VSNTSARLSVPLDIACCEPFGFTEPRPVVKLLPSVREVPFSGLGPERSSHGGDAISTLRRARSVKDQLEVIDETNLPAEVSQLPKI
jgi:hypothetical protein